MRLLFGILLILSLLLFAFMQWGGALTGASKNGQVSAELYPEKIKLLDKQVAKVVSASGVAELQPLAASAPLAASTPLPVSAPVASSAPVLASAPVAASTPVAVPVLLLHPVSEPAVAPVAKTMAIKSCMEWGEFSGTDLARATKVLTGLKLGERLDQHTVEYQSGYWVYIPPLSNKTAVNRKIEKIKAVGVDDYFVVQDSRKWFNAISLGVFKTRDAAVNFQLSLKKKGLTSTKVGERKKKLKYTVFVIKGVDAEGKARLAKLQKDFANSELKAVACQK